MITLPLKTYRATNGVAPYTYTWTTDDSCITFDTISGTSTNGDFPIEITGLDETCLQTANITLSVVDVNGCPTSTTFLAGNICDDLVLNDITATGEFTFTVSSTNANCSGLSFSWNYDTTLFILDQVFGTSYGSTLTLIPIDGVTMPSNTIISVTVTDCNGCSKTKNFTKAICRPTAQDFTYNMYCLDSQTAYLGGFTQIPEPTGCNYTYDYNNVSLGSPTDSGIVMTNSNGILTGSATISVTPGVYTINYTVENDFGLVSEPGLITIIINQCGTGNTISIPSTTYQIDCGDIIGDVVEIPISITTNSPAVVIDWTTWQLVTPPTPASPSITHSTNMAGEHVILYEIPAITGTDVFLWTVCDTLGNCATGTTYTILLDCASPPVTVTDADCVTCNQSVIVDVLTNDLPSGNPIDVTTVNISTAPTSGTANPLPDGTIIYTPSITTGTDTFQYTVSNVTGDVSLPATVTIDIICAGDDNNTQLCNT